MRAPTIRLRSLLRSRKFRPRRLLFKLNWKKRRGACALHMALRALAGSVALGRWGATGPCTGRTSRFKRVGSQRVPAVFLVRASVYIPFGRELVCRVCPLAGVSLQVGHQATRIRRVNPAFFITHALPEDATRGSRALRRGTERRTRLADAQGPRDTFAFAQDDDGLEPQIPFHDLNRLHGVAEHARQFNLRRGLIGQGPCVRP